MSVSRRALWAVLVCCTTACFLHAEKPELTPELVDSAIAEWVSMWNSYDLDDVSRVFVTDDRVTYFSSEREGLIVGFEAVLEHHRGFGFLSGGKDQDNKLWVEDVKVMNLGSSAAVAAIWLFKRADGTVQKGPMTAVYVVDGPTLRIVHLHFANYPTEEHRDQETEIEE
jgi:hypothetical protein